MISVLLDVSYILQHQFSSLKREVNYIHKLRIPLKTKGTGPRRLSPVAVIFNSRLIKYRKSKAYRLDFTTHLECTVFSVKLEVSEGFFLSNLAGEKAYQRMEMSKH